MDRNSGLMFGLAIGLMVGLVLVVILLKFANKDKKVKTEYDERQKEIRNKGYVIGFYTTIAMLSIESIWSITGYGFPIPEYSVFFLDIIVGLTTMCAYSIWNGVYWGLNNDKKRYGIIMVIAIILNLIPVINGAIRGDFLSSDPVESLPIFNIIVLVMFVVLLAVMLIRALVDKSCREED